MPKIGVGEKHPHFSMVGGRPAARRPVRPDCGQEILCLISVSFDLGPESEPAAGLGGKTPTTSGGGWGEKLSPIFGPGVFRLVGKNTFI